MTSSLNHNLTERLSVCPSCKSNRLRELGSPKYWIDPEHFAEVRDVLGLSKCRGCGLVIANPRPGGPLLSSFYDKPGYHCHGLHYDSEEASYAAARFSILERHSAKGVLVDYGCGSGNMLRAGLARGWSRIAGIEIGQMARNRLLKEGFEVYARLADAQKLQGQVNVVTMIQVLEHLVDPAASLKGVSDLLGPGGIFVVEVPNAGSLRARIAGSPLANLFSHPVQRYQAFPIHLYHFEASQLKLLLENHGFRMVELRTLGMGVEELWGSSRATSPVSDESDFKRKFGSVSVPQSFAGVQLFKHAIKTSISLLQLGEQLFAVCQKVT